MFSRRINTINTTHPQLIAIEGPIGVGKTTLAKRLSDSLAAQCILEQADENPFLEKFYQNRRASALPTQLFFLFQRSQQAQQFRQADLFTQHYIMDYLLEKDRLFARLNLDIDEWQLYEQVFQSLSPSALQPDLVIYLQAPTDVLLQRIHQRGRTSEALIEPSYLQQVCNAYTDFFHHYDASPLLIVNASGIDIVNSETDYAQLLEQIKQTHCGRNYFNPSHKK